MCVLLLVSVWWEKSRENFLQQDRSWYIITLKVKAVSLEQWLYLIHYNEQWSTVNYTGMTGGPRWKLVKHNVMRNFSESPTVIQVLKFYSLQSSHVHRTVEITHGIEERAALWKKMEICCFFLAGYKALRASDHIPKSEFHLQNLDNSLKLPGSFWRLN